MVRDAQVIRGIGGIYIPSVFSVPFVWVSRGLENSGRVFVIRTNHPAFYLILSYLGVRPKSIYSVANHSGYFPNLAKIRHRR